MPTTIKFYFDEMMSRPVAEGLEQRGHAVIMAIDSEMTGKDDDTEHLPFATENEAVLVPLDHGFAGRAATRSDHAGLICWTGSQTDIGGMIRALHEFAETNAPDEIAGRVFWLK